MAKKSRSAGEDEFRALVDRKKKQSQRIPTQEEFARADAGMAAQIRICATVRDNVFRSFAARVPLREIFLFGGTTSNYQAYVFYESDVDIETFRGSHVEQAIKDAITQGFASTSDRNPPTVAFNFDSHENVKKQCNGHYRQYLG